MTSVLLAGGVSLAVTSIALPATRSALMRRGLLDVPGNRSLHLQPIPRGAGPALLAGCTAALLVGQVWAVSVWIALFGFTAIGLWDDLSRASASTRLVLQLTTASAAVVAIGTALVGPSPLALRTLFAVGATVLIVAVVNATNFMDGVNGISGLHAVLWGAVYASMFADLNDQSLLVLSVALSVAGLGFLPWNVPLPRLFLGDSGSYFIGSAVAILALTMAFNFIVAALAPLAIYFADTSTALVRRMLAGHSPTTPHRDHTYQQLAIQVDSHMRASLVVLAFSAATSALGLASRGASASLQIVFVTVIAALCLAYLRLPSSQLALRLISMKLTATSFGTRA